MFELGDKVEFCGEMRTAIGFFNQPTVVLEGEDGTQITVALTALLHNRMQQTPKDPKA